MIKTLIHNALYNWRISTVRDLQYVTIDRGNRFRGSNRGASKDETSNLSSVEDKEELVTDAPQAITSTGRNLE